jgi:sec-independent protein translocase protein TatA
VITANLFGPDTIIVIVVAVVVLLFGGSKLPKLARGLGSASHEFKKGLEEGANEGKESGEAASAAPTIPAASESVSKD